MYAYPVVSYGVDMIAVTVTATITVWRRTWYFPPPVLAHDSLPQLVSLPTVRVRILILVVLCQCSFALCIYIIAVCPVNYQKLF